MVNPVIFLLSDSWIYTIMWFYAILLFATFIRQRMYLILFSTLWSGNQFMCELGLHLSRLCHVANSKQAHNLS